MKKTLFLTIFTVFILTGCVSKSSFSFVFDNFSINVYDNNKTYIDVPLDNSIIGIKMIKGMKEQPAKGNTGFINSFIIVRTSIKTGIDIKDLVVSNTKELQLKLLKYQATDNESRKVQCNDLQYSGYITAFSYQLDTETLYGGQYFFADDEALYIVSLSSDDQKDIQAFIKSIGTITCN